MESFWPVKVAAASETETSLPELVSIGDARLNEAQPLLSLRRVSKRYPGVTALEEVDLDVWRGEIHAVVGENGAGKSTLIKIITGVVEKDAGEVRANGDVVQIDNPRKASRLGIAAVPQDILLVPELPIGRNILLGMEGALARRGILHAEETVRVTEALRQVGANFSAAVSTRSLSVPQLRLAQIARALIQSREIIVLDEPTAVLSEPDAEHLLERLMAFRDSGKAIVYITHRLNEIMRIADRVTVLRDGKCVGHFSRGNFDRADLVALMAKGEQTAVDGEGNFVVKPAPTASGIAMSADEYPTLVVRGVSTDRRFIDISFSAQCGEIVGLAGVQGSGHGHVLRAIAGVDPRDAGKVYLSGIEVPAGSPLVAYRAGVLLVPADRRGSGIVASQTIRENIVFGPQISRDCTYFGFRVPTRERAVASDQMEMMSIRARSAEIVTGSLSGGNQQKVALARALSGNFKVLLMEEPTQGIDLRSRAEIHSILRRVTRDFKCVLVIASSEFEELIGLADVIHVMRLGRLVASFAGNGVSYQDILHEALP
jgi:ABC-type sugar transport system ATPase subunit